MSLDVNRTWLQIHYHLRAFIARRAPQDIDVDDILQEVFLRLYRSLDTLKDPQRLVSWIYQITRNVISDQYRSSSRQREIPKGSAMDLEASYAMPDPTSVPELRERGPIHKELAACLLPMIELLPNRDGEALRLVELNGMTQKTAARRLGISLSPMKSRVQRSRRELKHLMEQCCNLQLDRRGTITGYSLRRVGCDPCGSLTAPGQFRFERFSNFCQGANHALPTH